MLRDTCNWSELWYSELGPGFERCLNVMTQSAELLLGNRHIFTTHSYVLLKHHGSNSGYLKPVYCSEGNRFLMAVTTHAGWMRLSFFGSTL